MALSSHDVDNDGQLELVCAWSHSKFDARHWQTGEVIFKKKVDQKIANVIAADWLDVGYDQIIVCSRLGQG